MITTILISKKLNDCPELLFRYKSEINIDQATNES